MRLRPASAIKTWPGRELADALEDGARRGDVFEGEESSQRFGVEVARLAGREERLDLRGEEQPPVALRIMEGLDAHPVARQDEAAPLLVPEGDGEHAVQAVNEALGLFLVEVDDDLGVGAGRELVAAGLEVPAELGEIEDLAVVDDGHIPVLVVDRLVAGDEVDDAQAAHAQDGAFPVVEAVAVRPPVDDDGAHPADKLAVLFAEAAVAVDPADAAHCAPHFMRFERETLSSPASGESRRRARGTVLLRLTREADSVTDHPAVLTPKRGSSGRGPRSAPPTPLVRLCYGLRLRQRLLPTRIPRNRERIEKKGLDKQY